MTPRLASRDIESATEHLEAPRDPVRCEWFAVSIFVVGVVIGASLIASGQPLPSVGAVLVLVVLFALAVNRLALFPSELAVSAEAAVLVAAIVALRDNGPLVGPWCVALLAGPFDLVHWRQRSFVRMAYNAGNRMLATLAGAATFAIATTAGSSHGALVSAAFGAVLAFALVEAAVGTVLIHLRDAGSWRDSARVVLPMDLFTVPLGLIGSLAGYLATDVAWWAAVAVLTPTLFLPELAVVRSRNVGFPRGAATARRLAIVLAPSVAALTVLALFLPVPAASTVVALVVVALITALDLRVDTSVPPIVGALVGAAIVVSVGASAFGAALVAIGAVSIACVVARENRWWTPLLAGSAALVASAVYAIHPSRAFALGAAFTFELLVLVRADRSPRFGVGVWTAPLLFASVSLGYAWRAEGPLGGVVFVVGLSTTATVTALFGAPPWRSRFVGPRTGRCGTRAQRLIVAAAATVSLGLATAACLLRTERSVLVAGAAAAAAGVASMAMIGVRQWRFAPRPRARDAALLLASAVTAVVGYPSIALDGNRWSLAVLAVSLGVSTTIAWPIARVAAAVGTVRTSSRSETVNR